MKARQNRRHFQEQVQVVVITAGFFLATIAVAFLHGWVGFAVAVVGIVLAIPGTQTPEVMEYFYLRSRRSA